MIAKGQPSQKYRELQVHSATPLQRTLMAYDAAIIGCGHRDLKKTTDALNVLRGSLDLEQGEVAWRLFRIYQYCADLARAGQYDDASEILRSLVQAWIEVLVQEKDARPAQPAARYGVYASA
ncbi:MAG: flagellar protein FliS [Anaerolineae bacterium]|nr:flagellar protein FliS [Anaerolineae bacterium]